MRNLVREFKEFINRGNVVDLAVAFVLGSAFALVVTSFVDDVLMQIIAAIGGQPDFSGLTIDIGDGEIRYGAFLTALASFIVIAAAVFLIVKAVNRFRKTPEAGPTELDVLMEIRDELRRG